MRRMLALLLGLAMAVLVVGVTVATLPEKADARGRFKTVTKTFTNPTTILIPGFSSSGVATAVPYPSELSISGFKKGRVRDVNLTLNNFSHTFTGHVDVLLVHLDRNRTVMSDVGGSFGTTNATLTLNDEAAALLPEVGQLSTGSYQPRNVLIGVEGADVFPSPAPVPTGLDRLSGFDGTNPNGTWALYVTDDRGEVEAGQMAGGWSLKIQARVRR